MNDKAIQARREYKRKWNAEHRDKVKEYQRKYWEKKAAELDAWSKEETPKLEAWAKEKGPELEAWSRKATPELESWAAEKQEEMEAEQ